MFTEEVKESSSGMTSPSRKEVCPVGMRRVTCAPGAVSVDEQESEGDAAAVPARKSSAMADK